MQQSNGDANVWKGLIAGLAGGLLASWTMNQFQAAWTRVAEGFEKPHGAQSMQPSEGPNPAETADSNYASGQSEEDKEHQDDATVETAKVISTNVFGHELKESEKKPAGAAVHYAFGTATGGLYGAMAEMTPQVTAGVGLPFGAVFWVVADEVAVPLLGLAKGPTAYPVSTHAYALASHLVYGVTAELGRRAVRQVL
jgi:putative membrane protein